MTFDPSREMKLGVKAQEDFFPVPVGDILDAQRYLNAAMPQHRYMYDGTGMTRAASARRSCVKLSVKAIGDLTDTVRETSAALAGVAAAIGEMNKAFIGVDYGVSRSFLVLGDTAPDGSVTITHELDITHEDSGYVEALQKCCDFDDSILYALAEKARTDNERRACRFLMTARLEAKAARARSLVLMDDFDLLPDAEPEGIVPRPPR